MEYLMTHFLSMTSSYATVDYSGGEITLILYLSKSKTNSQ